MVVLILWLITIATAWSWFLFESWKAVSRWL